MSFPRDTETNKNYYQQQFIPIDMFNIKGSKHLNVSTVSKKDINNLLNTVINKVKKDPHGDTIIIDSVSGI